MAYFRCSTGSASSGDGVALVVTCDQNFAGSVITATNGTDTFTETCPSASPYTVRFEDIPVGTYTISGVAQGQTFTTQYTVLDYTTSLHGIPNGATVTPVNDIQIWLHCAEIWDKSYTSIAQVLADASTLQALIASNNAADYMARSTSWANSVTANSNAMTYIGNNNYCADKLLANNTWCNAICNSTYFESVLNVKVPAMTSATTPRGAVFASSLYDTTGRYDPWKAFDGVLSNNNHWEAQYGHVANQYIGYQFTQNVNVCKIGIAPDENVQYMAKDFYLEYSDDGSTWNRYNNMYSNSNPVANQFTWFVKSGTLGKHKYWRVYILNNKGGTTATLIVGELQFYGRA